MELRGQKFENDFDIYKAFSSVAPETAAMYGVWISKEPFERYLKIKNIKISITGEDLLALGIKPSKQYAEIFDAVLRKKLQHPDMTRDDEIRFLLTL